MSQDEEKHMPVAEEEPEDVQVTALHELNERFEFFTGQILVKLDLILEMKSSVDKLLQATNWKRAQDAERKRVQRAREAEAKNRGLLPLENNIWSRRESLKPKYLEWAHIGIQFGVIGDALLFLQYVAADWSTFKKKPIPRLATGRVTGARACGASPPGPICSVATPASTRRRSTSPSSGQ